MGTRVRTQGCMTNAKRVLRCRAASSAPAARARATRAASRALMNVVDQNDPAYSGGSLEKAIALVALVFVAEPSLRMKIFNRIDFSRRGRIARYCASLDQLQPATYWSYLPINS